MIKSTGDWVLTEVLEEKEKVTDSGIVVVGKQQKSTKVVKIVSFGPEANKESYLKKGDLVLVPANTGVIMKYEDTTYESHKEHSFLGVLE
jgi:co-chaperonin GroES (HSP10)